MLNESFKNKDKSRTRALQRSLLRIERTEATASIDHIDSEQFTLMPSKISLNDSKVEESKKLRKSSASSNGARFSASEEAYLQKAIKQNLKHYDVRVNVTIVGNERTGKTCLMRALTGAEFILDTPRSIGYTATSPLIDSTPKSSTRSIGERG